MNSEAKNLNLEKELKSSLLTHDKKNIKDEEFIDKEMEQIKKDFINLKSEFQLLKLCQRNQVSKTVEMNKHGKDINEIKCNGCALKFKTENGLKVHIELIHPNQICNQATLKCKYCVISCTDSDVMKKHKEREHRFICQK